MQLLRDSNCVVGATQPDANPAPSTETTNHRQEGMMPKELTVKVTGTLSLADMDELIQQIRNSTSPFNDQLNQGKSWLGWSDQERRRFKASMSITYEEITPTPLPEPAPEPTIDANDPDVRALDHALGRAN